MNVIAGVVRAYYGAVLAAESLKTAEQAVRSAEADLKRAEAVRAAGMSTDVDVLSIRVHLAAVTEQRIQRAADLEVARGGAERRARAAARHAAHVEHAAGSRCDLPDLALDGLERRRRERGRRPGRASLAASLAQTQADAARGALLPQVSFHGGLRSGPAAVRHTRRRQLAGVGVACAGTSSMAGRTRRASRKRPPGGAGAKPMQQRVGFGGPAGGAPRLGRICAPRSSASKWRKPRWREAEESLRITQNRYEAGMTNVTDLLRTETAVLESRTRYLAAVHDQRIAATMLELAAGRLTADSEVLN